MRKPYQKPALKKLTPEQAKLKVVGRASRGDQGAKQVLDTMFPDPKKKKSA